MKKQRWSAIAFLAIIGISSLTSCGGGEDQKSEDKTSADKKVEKAVKEPDIAVPDHPGKEVFKTNGCVACHEPNRKVVGPALKIIAAAYSDDKEALTTFLKGEGEAIVEPDRPDRVLPEIEVT